MNDLTRMNLIAIIQQLPKEDIEFVQTYINTLEEKNQELNNQLSYLRSGEYINQLKFERNMLENVANNLEISMEDREFIDMTHRNTELLEENQKLKDQIAYLRRDIERQETKITDLENERVPYTNEYVDKVKELHNKATDFIKEYRKNRNVFKWNEQDYIDVIDEIDDILKEVE